MFCALVHFETLFNSAEKLKCGWVTDTMTGPGGYPKQDMVMWMSIREAVSNSSVISTSSKPLEYLLTKIEVLV